ncbi:cytochrome c and c1 heme-lyase, partial [Ceraceosorus guamensis]
PAGCPMHKAGSDSMGSSPFSAANSLNPLNYMPFLSQARESVKQTVELSTERIVSSIPRSQSSAPAGASPYDAPASTSDGASSCPVMHDATGGSSSKEAQASNWEYPSPQQFYNALVRKGWETPEEHVEMMVLVHNFLNEEAWKQVLEWEEKCGRDSKSTSLVKFQGRPGTLSPKARFYSYLGAIAPNTYSSEPPFDRHDWVVRSSLKSANSVSTASAPQGDQRYVIDYYSGPDDPETGEPVFHLDIRPALD